MKKLEKMALTALEKAAKLEAGMVEGVRPPVCNGIIYQPKRPQRNK